MPHPSMPASSLPHHRTVSYPHAIAKLNQEGGADPSEARGSTSTKVYNLSMTLFPFHPSFVRLLSGSGRHVAGIISARKWHASGYATSPKSFILLGNLE